MADARPDAEGWNHRGRGRVLVAQVRNGGALCVRGALTTVAGLVVIAGCGTSSVVVTGEPVQAPYRGPMRLAVDHADDASVLERSGVAGRALECRTEPHAGGSGDYDSGLASTQGSAASALENYLSEEPFLQLPREGYRVERADDGRVLFSYDVNGRTKVAIVAARRMRDFNDDQGWGIETGAQCDPSEFPASVTDAMGIEVCTTPQAIAFRSPRSSPVQGLNTAAGRTSPSSHSTPGAVHGSTCATRPASSTASLPPRSTRAAACRRERPTPASSGRAAVSGWTRTAARPTWWSRRTPKGSSDGRPLKSPSSATNPPRPPTPSRRQIGVGAASAIAAGVRDTLNQTRRSTAVTRPSTVASSPGIGS